jgi:hypothetical protein
LSAELLERSLRRGVEVQAGADLGARRGPCGSLEQLRSRVGETAGAGNEHVASVQRCLERLQHAEGVCAPVDLVLPELRVREHESAPPAADARIALVVLATTGEARSGYGRASLVANAC